MKDHHLLSLRLLSLAPKHHSNSKLPNTNNTTWFSVLLSSHPLLLLPQPLLQPKWYVLGKIGATFHASLGARKASKITHVMWQNPHAMRT